MMKNWENNGTGEIGLVTPTPKLKTGLESHRCWSHGVRQHWFDSGGRKTEHIWSQNWVQNLPNTEENQRNHDFSNQ